MKLFNVAIGMAGLAAAATLVGCGSTSPAANGVAKIDLAVDGFGKLHVPDSYRTTYQFMGTWAVAQDEGPGSVEIHSVYASPGTIDAYRKDHQFPDGAVLVKEVYKATTEPMTTGTVSHEHVLRGWFVMVRDRNGHHPQNEVWGDGWGWSWFEAGNPSVASRNLPMKDGIPRPTFDYRDNCKSCHSPAQATEWIFTQGYPPLKG